jgi:hypothetical protein
MHVVCHSVTHTHSHTHTHSPHAAFQRIEPKIAVSDSVGIVSATVTMSSHTSLDAMALQESLVGTHDIVGKYADGVLTLTAKDESVTDPSIWTYVLSQAAYRFPDSYKPCSSFLDGGYNPDWFTFQVTDRNGAVSNSFVKKMELTTAAWVVAAQRSVVISRP